ncbi:MAG TPA: hypothetical protein VGP72_11550 [Planctomycetota bacterium]|jgi:DNA polymerase III delta subunit
MATAQASKWTRQTLPRVLLIIGAETALREDAIAAVKAAAFGAQQQGINMVTLHGPASANEPQTLTPADVLDEACTASMFAADDEPKVVLVRQADVFLTDKEWREIFERNAEKVPSNTTLIFEAATFGQLKNTRFYKQLVAQKAVVDCESLAGRYGDSPQLQAEVDARARKRGLNVTHGAMLALLARSSKELGILDEELGKLALALRPQGAVAESQLVTVTEEHIAELCASTATFNAFAFCDALLDRNASRTMEVLGAIFDRGIADSSKAGKIITNEGSITMLLLGALTWKLSQLQDARTGLDMGRSEHEAFGAAKVPAAPFIQDGFRRTLRKHTTAALRRSLDALYHAYLDLRLSGQTPREVMEQLAWKILRS